MLSTFARKILLLVINWAKMAAGLSVGNHGNKGRQFRLASPRSKELPVSDKNYMFLIPPQLGDHTDQTFCTWTRLLGFSWCQDLPPSLYTKSHRHAYRSHSSFQSNHFYNDTCSHCICHYKFHCFDKARSCIHCYCLQVRRSLSRNK